MTNDPASFANSLYPINEPAESRHGGSHKVDNSGRHKQRKSRHKNEQFKMFDDDFNGFD